MTPAGGGARLRTAGWALTAAAVAGTVFAVLPAGDAVRIVRVTAPVVAVLLVVAALGALGTATHRSVAYVLAAGVALVAALVQITQFGRDTNWLGGNGSTSSFLTALALGFGGLWLAARTTPPARAPH